MVSFQYPFVLKYYNCGNFSPILSEVANFAPILSEIISLILLA